MMLKNSLIFIRSYIRRIPVNRSGFLKFLIFMKSNYQKKKALTLACLCANIILFRLRNIAYQQRKRRFSSGLRQQCGTMEANWPLLVAWLSW